jgi:hypothetical protein
MSKAKRWLSKTLPLCIRVVNPVRSSVKPKSELRLAGLEKMKDHVKRQLRSRDPRVITKRDLLEGRSGSILAGYPADLALIEESWATLRDVVSISRRLDFLSNTAQEEAISVHWRLGDYVGNTHHGAMSWDSLLTCINSISNKKLPIRIFTDSPDLANHLIGGSLANRHLQVISNDIWSDLFSMTRCKYFIGTHSGVSFLAALALRWDNPDSQTFLPDRWYVSEEANEEFIRTPLVFGGSVIYSADLVVNNNIQ